ncbi:DUF3995 domain-containing protein [Burkholderia stabilis]|uniref:DUF3995 domain-containing protein n=1 Tax=Burkholderia stabilis TaxID=95485 RepID=UPI0015893618|nr:DUF3995 domain-containing protein [Burkholderia stabilis]
MSANASSSDLLNIAVGVLAAAYLSLALLHVYWASGGHFGVAVAVPSVNGHFVFRPGRVAILSVAILLGGCGVLLFAWIGVLRSGWQHASLRIPVSVLGVVMLARAIGDFRYVGFFRVVRQTNFARMDRRLYTPFCLAAGILIVGSAIFS